MRKLRDVLAYEEDEFFRYLDGEDQDGLPEDDPHYKAPSETEVARRARLVKRARREVAWFYRVMGGRVPDEGVGPAYARPAAQVIEACLKRLNAFQLGTLSLRYTPKDWPPLIAKHYGGWTSLVVRLGCALKPTQGKTTEELESAMAERLEAAILDESYDGYDLWSRAETHENLAVHAYVKARGNARAVLPANVKVEAKVHVEDQ